METGDRFRAMCDRLILMEKWHLRNWKVATHSNHRLINSEKSIDNIWLWKRLDFLGINSYKIVLYII